MPRYGLWSISSSSSGGGGGNIVVAAIIPERSDRHGIVCALGIRRNPATVTFPNKSDNPGLVSTNLGTKNRRLITSHSS